MKHLDELESKSIFIIREAYACIKPLGMLWSIGKDSTVLLWLVRKAFFGHVPIPLIHIDTSFKIPEMIAYRDRLAQEWGFELIVGQNKRALSEKQTFPHGNLNRVKCCQTLKTESLKETLAGDDGRPAFGGVILGIRADEEGSRSKERYFSPRNEKNKWDIYNQPPEFWNQFKTEFPPHSHVRIHPLLDWSEINVWEYIAQEKIPTVSLYYDQGDGQRYRSLGCHPCTMQIKSKSKTPEDIVDELREGPLARVAERAGRAQDMDDGGGLEALRQKGYM